MSTLPRPSKIVCVGRNYRAHAKELGNEVPTEPLLFIKPSSALIANDGVIWLPPESQRVEHEGELAVVIARTMRRATVSEAQSFIAGYACANDVTARDLQRKDGQFTRGKGFDSFCAVGEMIATRPAPDARVTLTVNGVQKQNGSLKDMVFSIDVLLAFISTIMTLEPGDIVLTGTPEGVGPLSAGDVVQVAIDGVPSLTNSVQQEVVDPTRTSAAVLHSQ